MKVRYRAICERIKARAQAQTWESNREFSMPPATAEELRSTEEALGISLPPMLRTLYMDVANGGDNLIPAGPGYPMVSAHSGRWPERGEFGEVYVGHASLDQCVSYSGWRFPRATREALRRQRGAFVRREDEEDGHELPDGFVYLADMGCSVCLYFDGHTGELFFEDSGCISYCAPTVEDWLERELDAPLSIRAAYLPHAELRADSTEDAQTSSDTEGVASLPRGAERPSPEELTRQLRMENLANDEPSPPVSNYIRAADRRVRTIGWNIAQARYSLLRQYYDLLTLIEHEASAAGGEPVGEERFITGLLPLITAEAHLANMTKDIQSGVGWLFEHNRRDWRTGRAYPD